MDMSDSEGQIQSVEMGDDEVLHTGRYIKADDVAQLGERTLTIRGMRKDTFRDGETKAVLLFEDGSALTLNAGRTDELSKMVGAPIKVSAVKGLDVTLYPIKTGKKGPMANSIGLKPAPKGAF
jgi:hypothetical protein